MQPARGRFESDGPRGSFRGTPPGHGRDGPARVISLSQMNSKKVAFKIYSRSKVFHAILREHYSSLITMKGKGILFGLLSGTVLGVLFAPEKGKKLRDKVKKEVDDGGSGFETLKEAFIDLGVGLYEVVKDTVEVMENHVHGTDFEKHKMKGAGGAKKKPAKRKPSPKAKSKTSSKKAPPKAPPRKKSS